MPELLGWLRDQLDGWNIRAAGVLVAAPGLEWPLAASTWEDLVARLVGSGALVDLPTESAALANVVEQAILGDIHRALDRLVSAGENVSYGTAGDRNYPDLEVSGVYFNAIGTESVHIAVDVKVAKTKLRKRGARTKTQSRPTLYTGNTYFKYPELDVAGCLRPFGDYAAHLDVLVLYDHEPDQRPPLTNVEVVVHPSWRIASTKRSSTTREYIGAVDDLEALRSGHGEFDSEEDFYTYWRRFKFKTSAAVLEQLRRER